MAKDEYLDSNYPINPSEDTYEMVPEKEMEDLKKELRKLKEAEEAPSEKLQVNLIELNAKIETLMAVFEEALHGVKVEGEGSVVERINALEEKLGELFEQNKTIAEGMIALVDTVKGKSSFQMPSPRITSMTPLPGLPPLPSRKITPRINLPPPPAPSR